MMVMLLENLVTLVLELLKLLENLVPLVLEPLKNLIAVVLELLEKTALEGPGGLAVLEPRAEGTASRSTAASSTIRRPRSFRSSTAAPRPNIGSRRPLST